MRNKSRCCTRHWARAFMLFALLPLMCALPAGAAAPHPPPPPPAELWWSYLASYDDGPGSILLDLNLYERAPLADYPQLLVTGSSFETQQFGGLPEPGDLDRIGKLSLQTAVAVKAVAPAIHAGTFTHGGEQLNYFYLRNTPLLKEKIEHALRDFYARACRGCKTFITLRDDSAWATYRTFLFPNYQTRYFYREELKAIGFSMPPAAQ